MFWVFGTSSFMDRGAPLWWRGDMVHFSPLFSVFPPLFGVLGDLPMELGRIREILRNSERSLGNTTVGWSMLKAKVGVSLCSTYVQSVHVANLFWRVWKVAFLDSMVPYLVGGLEHFLFSKIYIGNNNPNWLIFFFRGVETTNQICLSEPFMFSHVDRGTSQPLWVVVFVAWDWIISTVIVGIGWSEHWFPQDFEQGVNSTFFGFWLELAHSFPKVQKS